jgi:hypothetical protein
MKFDELFEDAQKLPDGTYAGVRFSEKTVKAIEDYCKANNIPKAVPPNKLHSTVLYSRKYCPDYTPVGEYEEKLIGTPIGFEVWKSQPTKQYPNPTSCLVLKYDCPALVARHKELMDTHKATYDHPQYSPHVTFSYDIGDLDINELPKFEVPIEIVYEYGEDLNLGWADQHANRGK